MGIEGALRGRKTFIWSLLVDAALAYTAVIVLVWINYGWYWALLPTVPAAFVFSAIFWPRGCWPGAPIRKRKLGWRVE
ncbi:MAG: hypothetical protein OXH70_17285 [Acidobacteria bacterium]|nr:hypothetical protein [Acidobacteriota bacterium]